MLNKDYLRVLYVDLTKREASIKERKDLYSYLGGVGLASKLLEEELRPRLEALDSVQPIIFAIGPLSTIFPVATKGVAMFKSPLTGELGESYAGGRFALAMFLAGYDALVITGKAAYPTYLSINGTKILFRDARPLWGLSIEETGRLLREEEAGSGFRSTLRIGPAGERRIKFANVNVDTYRHFGRLGLGALLGSKMLKGLVITGQEDYPIPASSKYNQTYENIYQKVTNTELMEKYHDLGTAGNVQAMNALNSLPTRNLQSSNFEHTEKINGEAFAQEHLGRKVACIGCPIGCIHIGIWREQFGKSHEYEMLNAAYDYELIYALGSYLGIERSQDILQLIEKVESQGLDAMSTGVALGWATEALEKNFISLRETIVPLAFGSTSNYLKAIDYLTQRENDFYFTLGEGTWKAVEKYGGQDFAALVGKLEMAGYHTGYASILGQIVGSRHSHLDNAGYSLDQSMKEIDKEEIVSFLLKEESERCLMNSLTICLFARKVYDLETVELALSSIGIRKSQTELLQLGREIFLLKLRLKESMGFELKEISFPKRFFQTPTLHGKLEEKFMDELLNLYQEKLKEDRI